MGIYIEGLDKQVQKGAESITVTFWDKDELIINEYDIGDMSKVTDLDIVRCGECKWSKTYYVKADNSTRLCCDNYCGLDKDVDPADFCPYGERRSE